MHFLIPVLFVVLLLVLFGSAISSEPREPRSRLTPWEKRAIDAAREAGVE
jgi:hypothetical protein